MTIFYNRSIDHAHLECATSSRPNVRELLVVVLFWALQTQLSSVAAADEQNLNIQHDMEVLSPSEPLHELVPSEATKRKPAKLRAKRKRARTKR